ncbi:MAG TPA: hypothetical protein VNB54_07100, partial [Alphaproteobacteria bacterium]|nr:hypothetical protein [Alphaproteobacteria bacterium]
MGKSVSRKRSDLLGLIRDFNINCSNKDSQESEVERPAAELYDLLLRPVIAGLPPSGMVAIEWDDAVPSFPIEALKKPGGPYFDDDYTVLQSPGILAEDFLGEPVPLKPKEKFLVADASPATGPEVLRGHDLPARAISQTYSNEVLTGPDLT